MNGFLLDTNVVSELVRRDRNRHVVAWMTARRADELYLSTPTIGELTRGAKKKGDTRKGRALQRWIEEDLARQFDGRLLSFDLRAAREWGALMGEGDRVGKTLPAADAQIAAIAAVHGLTLVTRNVKDFERMTDAVLNPFDAP